MKKIMIIICICMLLSGCSNKKREFDDYIGYTSYQELEDTCGHPEIYSPDDQDYCRYNDVYVGEISGRLYVMTDYITTYEIYWYHDFDSEKDIKNNEDKIKNIIDLYTGKYGDPITANRDDTSYYIWKDTMNNSYTFGITTSNNDFSISMSYF